MINAENVVYLVEPKADHSDPDAIGIIVAWANQMDSEGRMSEAVRAAFIEHFGFFAE